MNNVVSGCRSYPLGEWPFPWRGRNEVAVNPASRAVFTVGVGDVNGIGRHGFNARLEQALLQLDTLLQPGTLVESVKREVLDERDPVHLDVVDLSSELHVSRLFSPDNGTDVVLIHALYLVVR